jgi:hypothetical protein
VPVKPSRFACIRSVLADIRTSMTIWMWNWRMP